MSSRGIEKSASDYELEMWIHVEVVKDYGCPFTSVSSHHLICSGNPLDVADVCFKLQDC